ncbi:hypothetical protein [Spectribacter hydrogenoxidans]|uniref:Uncharacterized protein n=1 Tax=Spectribacter hydrogenoxidans TaxID=3075608 RepID=A0ABU3BZY9_9GAMM|nr:hypothetical protein [Salinisphaera sp. W335]MDT0634871.1 hypothetical protein [Salinisphaera sp. W335]
MALYHPRVFDLHEQRLLDPAPTPHPLHGHPARGHGYIYPRLTGTWNAAQQLGYLEYHPKLTYEARDGTSRRAPHPLVGDLLLFIERPGVPDYCINWNIKSQRANFKHRPTPYTSSSPYSGITKTAARNCIEAANYASADIPTKEIAGTDIPPVLTANLTDGFVAACEISLPSEIQEKVIRRLRAAIGTMQTPLDIWSEFSLTLGLTHYQFRTAMYTGVWRRQLRLELTERILFDRPMIAERTDILDIYASWFRGPDA